MSRYGDTPAGIVESVMEFLRICQNQDFANVVISIKSSNTRSMVYTVRLLNYKMRLEEMSYPLHLGVTEAGRARMDESNQLLESVHYWPTELAIPSAFR